MRGNTPNINTIQRWLKVLGKNMHNWSIKDSRSILYGTIWIILALVFWLHEVGNPFHEFALICRAEIASGHLVETFDMETERNDRVYFYELGVYSFRLPDGRQFKASTKGDPDPRVEVEYLPDNPSINRIKGDGVQSITEFLWRKAGVGGFILAFLVSPGFMLIKTGLKRNENDA